jgi:hypothetical protein
VQVQLEASAAASATIAPPWSAPISSRAPSSERVGQQVEEPPDDLEPVDAAVERQPPARTMPPPADQPSRRAARTAGWRGPRRTPCAPPEAGRPRTRSGPRRRDRPRSSRARPERIGEMSTASRSTASSALSLAPTASATAIAPPPVPHRRREVAARRVGLRAKAPHDLVHARSTSSPSRVADQRARVRLEGQP